MKLALLAVIHILNAKTTLYFENFHNWVNWDIAGDISSVIILGNNLQQAYQYIIKENRSTIQANVDLIRIFLAKVNLF